MTDQRTSISRIAIHEGDRQLRRTSTKFGDEFREIRLRAGVSQAAVARGIGVVRSVICRLEQGDTDVAPRIRARAVALLGADFRLAVYPGSAPLIHDAAHARIVKAVLTLRHPRWRATVEAPVPGIGRRSTDIRLDHEADTVLIEVETHVRAFEAIIREGTEKRAAVLAVEPGRRVHVVLVLPPTRHHRTLASAHPEIVRAAFPEAPTEIEQALASPTAAWPGDGILWLGATRVGPAASPARPSDQRRR